jgi:AcrR family transcriptional regulator
MTGRQQLRSEETKRAILTAAGELFAERGFESVTMREIAKAAGCSHTTIYIYFKDKEALLNQLAMGPLQSLREQMESALQSEALSPDDRFRLLCRVFIRFCFLHRHMYTIIFMAQASRVDEEAPGLPVQKARNDLFGFLMKVLQQILPPVQSGDSLLAYARLCFYSLHGFLSLYSRGEEPIDSVIERLGPTFDLAVEVMLAGFKQTAKSGAERQ